MEPHIFAQRWTTSLPRRWARNGAIVGFILAWAPYSSSRALEATLADGRALLILVVTLALTSGIFATSGWLLGRWARRSLRPYSSKGEWDQCLKAITRNWIIGMLAICAAMIILDAATEWRGQSLRTGGSLEAVSSNVGYLIGAFGAAILVGLVVGLASRRGLQRALADDAVLASGARTQVAA